MPHLPTKRPNLRHKRQSPVPAESLSVRGNRQQFFKILSIWNAISNYCTICYLAFWSCQSQPIAKAVFHQRCVEAGDRD